MPIEFSLTKRQQETRDAIHELAERVIRPQSLEWDRAHTIPREFLGRMAALAGSLGSLSPTVELPEPGKRDERRERGGNVSTLVGAEELSWGDPALLLSLPGPGLGGPPVRATGTSEQKARFFAPFKDLGSDPRWGAYALTEPGAGSDVAGIRTSCRRVGDAWLLNGRKCYITNGARASWVVVFATVDAALGRAGHRAFVVEAGTPGFSVGKIEEKMGLRASETAELVFDDCRVPDANLLGGEGAYRSKEGFMTAMKTFDNTRPIVAAMALGVGRAAFDHARAFVREHYVLSRPIPRYAAIAERLARVGRQLEAARLVTYRAAWMADEGIPNAKEASMAKAMGGQAAIHACIQAVEICGAEGTIQGDHRLLEKWFRDIKVYDIFEGTGQIQRVVISKRILTNLRSF